MKDSDSSLWEILVPGNYPLDHHKEWDKKVESIAGGLTILKPVKGSWVSDDGNVIREPMIPVRIKCKLEHMMAIGDMTRIHYEQEVVMYYEISNNVWMHNKDIGLWECHKGKYEGKNVKKAQ